MRARTIAERLGCDLPTAKRIKRVMEGEEDPRKAPELRKGLVGTSPTTDRQYAAMMLFDVLLGGSGVEGGHSEDSFEDGYDFVNVGTMYACTIVYVSTHRNPWQVCCLADARIPARMRR